VTSGSISLKNLHVCCCANKEKHHENCLCRNIDTLDWWTARRPHHRRIWRILAVCLLIISYELLLLVLIVEVMGQRSSYHWGHRTWRGHIDWYPRSMIFHSYLIIFSRRGLQAVCSRAASGWCPQHVSTFLGEL
jgi:hypothetical protein